MRKAEFRRHSMVGPGGMSCPCCAPQAGNKYAARAVKIIKRQAKRREMRVENKLQGEAL